MQEFRSCRIWGSRRLWETSAGIQALYVFSAGHTARPEGARKLSPGFTLGKLIEAFRPVGARNARAIRFKGSELILAADWKRPNSFGPRDAKHIQALRLGMVKVSRSSEPVGSRHSATPELLQLLNSFPNYPSVTTGLLNTPIFSISISTKSPRARNCGGSMAMPTPSGVPVRITVPG